jgi:hypothetical protein
MTNSQYAFDMLDYLYEEGDRDLIFFGQILGMVSYDRNDNLVDKSPEKRIADAIKLVEYLISDGGFEAGQTVKRQDGTFVYDLYQGGLREFCMHVNEMYAQYGIDGVDLNSAIWLKKSQPGRPESTVPPEIIELFA